MMNLSIFIINGLNFTALCSLLLQIQSVSIPRASTHWPEANVKHYFHFSDGREHEYRSAALICIVLRHSATTTLHILLSGPNHHIEIARNRWGHVRCRLVQIFAQISMPYCHGHFAVTEAIHSKGIWILAVHIEEFQRGSWKKFRVAEWKNLWFIRFVLQMLHLTFSAYLLLQSFKKWTLNTSSKMEWAQLHNIEN